MSVTKNPKTKIQSPSELYQEYDWFNKLFPLALQKSSDGFFLPGLRCELVGISKNINLLQTKEAYFVTKVRIDKFYDMYLRISELAIPMLLNKGLGKSGRAFDITKMSRLEQEVLTGFCDYVSKIVVPFFDPPPVVNFVRTNFDITHLTFVIEDEKENISGRFIISVPDGRLSPRKVEIGADKFEYPDFYECHTEARLKIGKTRFSVFDLKSLEPGDLVVLEDSNLSEVTIFIKEKIINVKIETNLNIKLPFEESSVINEVGNMDENKDLWDSIEVDMYAELDPVKISLGDLKKIEQGLVIDIAALYENKVTLRVENKVIGHGDLVIVNDRYGVKISDIELRSEESVLNNAPAKVQANNVQPENVRSHDEMNMDGGEKLEDNHYDESVQAEETVPGNGDEEFDYSDFELEDQDI